jgi:hypothetical protein
MYFNNAGRIEYLQFDGNGRNDFFRHFQNKSAKEWLLDTGDSAGLGYSFGTDGSLILSIKNEGCRSFSLKMPLPVQHRISFELYEMPGENPLRWICVLQTDYPDLMDCHS